MPIGCLDTVESKAQIWILLRDTAAFGPSTHFGLITGVGYSFEA